MRKMRKITYLFELILILGILVGCGQKTSNESVPESDDWHDAQMLVHGVRLKDVGNMTVAELESLGFKKDLLLTAVNVPSKLEPDEKIYISMKSVDGSKEIYDFRVINKTGKKAPVDECNIQAIVVTKQDKEDDVLVSGTDIYLANGIGIGITSEKVADIMGAPDEEVIKDEEEKFYKRWTYKADSNGTTIVMIFAKETDVMHSLVVTY